MSRTLSEDQLSGPTPFKTYEKQFKALADEKRLEILSLLCNKGEVCVCDLQEDMNMPQSKLSYHLKLLLDAELITREKRGTWNYYSSSGSQLSALLSEDLCCLFRPAE
ncbi:ArsR/SmtB family transcription factor [Alteribacter keqinensis]|uniref:ArsR family transcriptional regulator n=1 Tax=Alteribacter keqinensis TaxID=2483800 RepID=A0A3M7TSK2_9BACI|nr:metalloregulator ArsR/SmtB family transcription factor [Alteribacter keqinensis]RNA68618.1 ArsR family transcriptional regulator [Alteribacter keqinensis]